jgi:putative ABC transport system ATP-binding protein
MKVQEGENMQEIMRIEHLNYKIPEGEGMRSILSDVSCVLEDETIYTISGPSGSGKTTLLYAMAGLLDDITGVIQVDDVNLAALKRSGKDRYRKQKVGMIFQNLNLFSFLNVEDNILIPLYVKKMPVDKEVKKQISRYLDLLHLGQIQKKSVASLSGGEQQRVAIIRTIIANPRLILCDEPTASLDSENVIAFMDALQMIQREQKSTIVIVTHDQRVFEYGDRKLYMTDGKLKM